MTTRWKTKPLKDVADIRVSNVDKKALPSERPVHLCNYMDVYSNDYVTSDHSFMAATATRNEIQKFGLRPGDVMITKDSESPDDIGVPSVIVGEIDNLVCGYHLALMRPKPNEICPVYLAKQLAAAEAKRYFGINASGSTRFGIPIGAIESFELPIPELPEQSKIAEVLSTVDRAIAQTEALIAKQQRIKTGLMQDLLTCGIDPHGNLRSEATHAFKDSPLGRIPAEWEVKPIDSVAEFVTSGARGWAKYYSEEGATFLRIGNLTREHINLRLDDVVYVQPPTSAEGTRTQVRQGDLLISVTADLGIIGVIPSDVGMAYVNQHIALARLDSEKVSPRFIGWFLSGHQGRKQFDKLNESGAKAGLNLPTVRSLLFPSPSLAEQKRIAAMLDASVEGRTKRIATLRKLRSLKTGLMQDLLTGKVRVTPLLEQVAEATA